MNGKDWREQRRQRREKEAQDKRSLLFVNAVEIQLDKGKVTLARLRNRMKRYYDWTAKETEHYINTFIRFGERHGLLIKVKNGVYRIKVELDGES